MMIYAYTIEPYSYDIKMLRLSNCKIIAGIVGAALNVLDDNLDPNPMHIP